MSKGEPRFARETKRPKDTEWRCLGCGKKLGYLDRDRKVVRIKSKDLYVFVEGGAVLVICRQCGRFNKIVDAKFAGSESVLKLDLF